MNDNIEPLPIESLLRWIKNTYDYRGLILISAEEDCHFNVTYEIDDLSYVDILDALASATFVMKEKQLCGDFDEENEI